MSTAPEDPKDPAKGITIRRFAAIAIGAGVLTAVLAFGVTALLVNIFEHKQEARNPFFRVVEVTDDTTDPAIWGKNFPLQHDQYTRTVDQVRTRYGGSEAIARTPSDADPRSVVSQSRLEEDPRLKIMWAGFAFAKDFREERGHAFMLEDQTFTDRQKVVKQPGACMQCHASVHTANKKLGDGDIMKGFEKLNSMPYAEARKLVEHPIACIDCHDPETMALRITRPAFVHGIKAYKASQGIENYDVHTMATHQEMRSFVCGQCHVEYYFKGPDKQLTFPWHKGLKADDMLAYYEEVGFHDWTHAETSAPVLKAQHPEFELWSQGVHARSGVSCADCHMPYMRVGAQKISDHHVRSPLLNINNACQTCHKFPEEEMLARAEAIQERNYKLRNLAMNALVDLINDIKLAKATGVDDGQLSAALVFQKRAQFYVDFIEAENSMGFHAPQEAARILGESINFAREGTRALRGAEITTSPLTIAQTLPAILAPTPAAAKWVVAGADVPHAGR